ncbi:MAG: glutathione binding-like protein [Hyphomonadaceae bacterium]
MGEDGFERAQIEMWDRRVELGFMLPLMFWVRHTHPALAKVEQQQTPAVGAFNQGKAMDFALYLDGELAKRPWIAGDRFTIADITAVCGADFAKLMKWRPGEELPNLMRWRQAIAARPAGGVGG